MAKKRIALLDSFKLKPSFQLMVKARQNQILLFSALFAVCGIYFFHCSEAKAANYSAFEAASFSIRQDHIGNTQLRPFKILGENQRHDTWLPGRFSAAEALRLFPKELSPPTARQSFSVAYAREYFIRTGLSPPFLFA